MYTPTHLCPVLYACCYATRYANHPCASPSPRPKHERHDAESYCTFLKRHWSSSSLIDPTCKPCCCLLVALANQLPDQHRPFTSRICLAITPVVSSIPRPFVRTKHPLTRRSRRLRARLTALRCPGQYKTRTRNTRTSTEHSQHRPAASHGTVNTTDTERSFDRIRQPNAPRLSAALVPYIHAYLLLERIP